MGRKFLLLLHILFPRHIVVMEEVLFKLPVISDSTITPKTSSFLTPLKTSFSINMCVGRVLTCQIVEMNYLQPMFLLFPNMTASLQTPPIQEVSEEHIFQKQTGGITKFFLTLCKCCTACQSRLMVAYIKHTVRVCKKASRQGFSPHHPL